MRDYPKYIIPILITLFLLSSPTFLYINKVKKILLLLLFCSIFSNNLFAQSDLKRDSKKIIQSAIEVGSGEKEIITVIKSLNNYEIGFEVGFSTSTVKVSGNDDNHEATMTTANKPYFSAKVATSFENLPMYKIHEGAGSCSDEYKFEGESRTRTGAGCVPYYWELTFSSVVMDRQQLDNDTIWESQKVGTEVTVDTYQFVFTVVPKTSQYHGEDFNVFVLYGLVLQNNIIKGDYYKTNSAEEKCDVAQTPSDVINYCEKKTYNKSGYSGGFLLGAHWVIPKYYSNFGLRASGADSINAKFYYGFYYAF